MKQQSVTKFIIVELREKLDGQYLGKKFSNYHLDDIRPISKSKNEWIFTITTTEKTIEDLFGLLKKDKNILSIREDKEGQEKMQSTNQDVKKVKPIIKQ